MKAVIYARYSSDSQREESIDGQLRDCKAFAKKNDIVIIDSYIDRALSAKTDNRPEFQRMIKDSGKNLFDIVLVWKLDRFSRNRIDSAIHKSTLQKNGVKVVSATENISDGAEGILLESLLEGLAEYYSADLSEKIKRGQTDNALNCKYNGGALPLGYTTDEENRYKIDTLAAPLVTEIFTKYANGITVKEITESLNARGIKTSRGNSFNKNSLHGMLKNRRYIGDYIYGETITPNGIPAIISKKLFERVEKRMEKNRKAPAMKKAKEDYLLTTKLFCGKCGAYMVGEAGTSRNGTVYYYYKCNTAKYKRTCDKKTVKKDWIENLVIVDTISMLFDDERIAYILKRLLKAQKEENTAIPILKEQLSNAEKSIANLISAIEQGVFTSSTKARLEELEDTKSKLEISILKEQIGNPCLSEDEITCWLHEYRELDMTKQTHRQKLVDSFVNSIYLYDDKIVLLYNGSEEAKTITFAELNRCSDMASVSPPSPAIGCFHTASYRISFSIVLPLFCSSNSSRENSFLVRCKFCSSTKAVEVEWSIASQSQR